MIILKPKRIFFINPPGELYVREDRCQVPVKGLSATAIRPPIDLAYLAAIAEKHGCECKIKDYPSLNGGFKEFTDDLIDFQPDMLVVSVTTPTIENDLKSLKTAKTIFKDIITAVKGAHFLTASREVLQNEPYVDIAFKGEYEFTFNEILEEKNLHNILGVTFRDNDKIIENPLRDYSENIDDIPFPARHLIDNNLYIRPDTGEKQTTIQTHRGCPYNCVYCLAKPFSKEKIRMRSVENVIDEIKECVLKYGIKNFFFRADTFTANKKWVMDFCGKIKGQNLNIKWVANSRVNTVDKEMLTAMKDAGCWLIAFGVESGNAEILKKIKKGITLLEAETAVELCKEAQIKTFLFFIIGFPWESEKEINDTINFALKLNGDYAEFHLPVPFPGTELYDIVKQNNLFEGQKGYDHSRPALKTFFLSAAETEKLRRRAIRKYYLRAGYVIKTLKSVKSRKEFFNYLKYGIKTLKGLL